MEQSMLETFADLGGTLGSLLACFWYIKYQSDQFSEREKRWMDKDTENDQALRDLMATSNASLIAVLNRTNENLKDMEVAISELREVIHADKK
jgi:ferric-dicitrate binding protein FerR (iron transport regulator)